MMIEQSLKQHQRLILNQTMQQSLKILQMDGVSLRDFIQEASLSNPFISITGIDNPYESVSASSNLFFQPSETLYDYLLRQVEMRYRQIPLRDIVISLILNLDKDGLLRIDSREFIVAHKISRTQFADALTLLQELDPVGVGGRSVQEVLLIQAQHDSTCPPSVIQILEKGYDSFLHNRQEELMKQIGITYTDFLTAKKYLSKLTIRPGAQFDSSPTVYRVPDLKLTVMGSHYRLSLTKYGEPELLFDSNSFDKMSNQVDADLQHYLMEKKTDYETMAKGIRKRTNTLLMVGEILVKRQWHYLIGGTDHIKPLLLRDVSEATQLSESTVSRAIKDEYLDAPRGIVAMIDLFTKRSLVDKAETGDSHELSVVRTVFAQEDKTHPLSDQQAAEEINKRSGITIARRTVAKYRKVLGIPTKTYRKIR